MDRRQVVQQLRQDVRERAAQRARAYAVVQTHPEWVQFSVRDRGPGVPRSQQKWIFERFARAHGDESNGLGLGLAIAKLIVEQHRGRIWVESSGKKGEGSTFYLRLPLGKLSE